MSSELDFNHNSYFNTLPLLFIVNINMLYLINM